VDYLSVHFEATPFSLGLCIDTHSHLKKSEDLPYRNTIWGLKSTDPATLVEKPPKFGLVMEPAGHSRTKGRCTRTKTKLCFHSDGKKSFADDFLDEVASSHHHF